MHDIIPVSKRRPISASIDNCFLINPYNAQVRPMKIAKKGIEL